MIDHAGRVYELTLNRTGKRGGSIKVTDKAGRFVPCEEALPDSVEDHWQHYKNDPNFKVWVTDDRYRVVIGPDGNK